MINFNETLLLITEAFDLFPDAIIVVNSKGIIINANKQVVNILGYTEEELKDKPLEILMPEKYRGGHSKLVGSFFNTTGARKMGSGIPLFGLHKSGKEVVIDIALSSVQTSTEKFSLAVIRDISDKVNLAKQLTKLEKIKTELEQFSYILTHDLKAPLQNVKALAHLIHLELSDKESNDIHTMINYLTESVESMENLISGVLEYHKAKLNKDNAAEDVDLNEVLEEVMKLIKKPEHFTIDVVKQQLPTVKCNRTMMLQVFLNFITNAIKYNDKKEGYLKIDWTEDEQEFQFEFADNGTIIPVDRREHIFDISSQLGKAKAAGSHGLGLPIVKQIIEGNDGNNFILCDESKLGGSVFKFSWKKK